MQLSYNRFAAAGTLAALALAMSTGLHGCADAAPSAGVTRAAESEPGWVPPDTFDNNVVATEGHPGWTYGEGSVGHDGSANFEVPIWVPRGRNGVQPSLSLRYNSEGGEGIFGVGWSLSGLSIISRCDRNDLIDGYRHAVDFTAQDAFCLDGERLVAGDDGAFWGGGTHRAWRNGFDRIEMEGNLGDPNLSFIVHKRNGTIHTYGGAPGGMIRNRRVEVDPSDGALSPSTEDYTYAWLLTRIEDRHGNYLEVEYERDTHPDYSVEVRPREIRYTGHASVGPPSRGVRFNYGPRSTNAGELVQWISRFGLRTSRRVESIDILGPGTPSQLRQYQLAYEVSAWSHGERLRSVTECDADGVCREPVVLAYTGISQNRRDELDALQIPLDSEDTILRPFWPSRLRSSVAATEHRGSARTVPALRAGGGRMELGPAIVAQGFVSGSRFAILRESGGSHGRFWEAETGGGIYFEPTDINVFAPTPVNSDFNTAFDYNRDGRADFLEWSSDGDGPPYTTELYINEVDHHALPGASSWYKRRVGDPLGSCLNAISVESFTADMDGNSISDVILGCEDNYGNSNWTVRLQEGDDSLIFGSPRSLRLPGPVGGTPFSIIEWDGDAGMEILSQTTLPSTPEGDAVEVWEVHQLNGDLESESQEGGRGDTGGFWLSGDFNGDGLSDMVRYEQQGVTPLKLRLNLGGALGTVQDATRTGDRYAWILTGDHFPETRPDTTGGTPRRPIVLDLNADGRDDVLVPLWVDAPQPSDRGAYPAGWTSLCRSYWPREDCIPVRDGRTTLAVALLSDGGGFIVMPFASIDNLGGDWDLHPVDLDANGMTDMVSFERLRQCGSDEPLRPGCTASDPGDDVYAFLSAGRFREPPDQLIEARVGDSGANWAEFTYRHEVDATSQECEPPLRCITEGRRVVATFTDRLNRRHQHWFRDPVASTSGREFLGFGHHFEEDLASGRITETRFMHRTKVDGYGYPHAWIPSEVISYVETDPGNYTVFHFRQTHEVHSLSTLHHALLLKEASSITLADVNSLSGGCRSVPPTLGCEQNCRVCEPIEYAGGTPVRTSHRDHLYDAHGTQTYSSTVSDGETTEVSIVPEHRPAEWLIGMPGLVTTTSSAIVGATNERHVRVVRSEFDADGFLERRIVRPASPLSETVFVPNQYGQVSSRTVYADRVATPRTTSFQYDSDSTFVRAVTNAEGHTRTSAVHPGLGVTVLTIDENGVTSRAQYDGFGRERRRWVEGLDPAAVQTEYLEAPDERIEVVQTQTGHGRSGVTTDHLGRPFASRVWQGKHWAYGHRSYDTVGRVEEVHGPYLEGSEAHPRHRYHYDTLGRVSRVVFGDTSQIEYAYSARAVEITDREGNHTTTRFDLSGRMVRTVQTDDGLPVEVTHDYGPFGQLHRIIHSDGTVWSSEFDDYGRVTRSIDPDAGERIFELNGFGEVDAIRAASSALVREVRRRDNLGRALEVWTDDDGVSEFEFDTAPHGVGRLHWGLSPDGVRTQFEYDTLGRASRQVQELGTESFAVEVRFDALGRLHQIEYPHSSSGLTVEYGYAFEDFSRPNSVSRVLDGGSLEELWRAEDYDAVGHVTLSFFGNGIHESRQYDPHRGLLTDIEASPALQENIGYDLNGNVTSRRRDMLGTSESFAYDSLNRLEAWTRADGATEMYDHDQSGNLSLNAGVVQRYGESGAGPHQLTSDDGGATFTYDDRGRALTLRDTAISDWTAFDLPRRLTTADGRSVVMSYDSLGRRVQKVVEGGNTVVTVGDLYERIRSGDVLEHRFRVAVDGRAVAEIAEDMEGGQTTHYLHQDHLGSVASVTDAEGNVEQFSVHQPYGLRETHLPDGGLVGAFSSRGFTSHEHDEETGLINMRGRIYDPSSSRFLSVDPVLRSPWLTASLNAYSYVEDNPLSSTDPSGFCPNGCRDEETFGYGAGGVLGFLAGLVAWWETLENGSGGGTGHGAGGTGISPTRSGGSRSAPRRTRVFQPSVPDISTPSSTMSGVSTLSAQTRQAMSATGWCQGGCHSFDGGPTRQLSPEERRYLYDGMALAGLSSAHAMVTMAPGVGELDDAMLLTDPGATLGERAIAGASLSANVVFLGFLPNASSVLRHTDEIADVGRALDGFSDLAHGTDAFSSTIASARSGRRATQGGPVPGAGRPQTPDEIAIRELADEAGLFGHQPIPRDQAELLLDWADEYGYPGWRADPGSVSGAHWLGPHIHIPSAGRSGHVLVEPGVLPR